MIIENKIVKVQKIARQIFIQVVYLGMHDLFGMYFTTKTCNYNSVILWDIMNNVYNT